MATIYFFTPHSFKHTHTSLSIEAEVGIKEIQQQLGHTDIKLQ
jgi:integrase